MVTNRAREQKRRQRELPALEVELLLTDRYALFDLALAELRTC